MPFYLTPKQDDFNKIPEVQVCIAEALYDVDSIVAGPEGGRMLTHFCKHLTLFRRSYDVEQDIAELFIEIAKHKRAERESWMTFSSPDRSGQLASHHFVQIFRKAASRFRV